MKMVTKHVPAMKENGYTDAQGVRYVAKDAKYTDLLRRCKGCTFVTNPLWQQCMDSPNCGTDGRADKRSIIWVKAE